MAGLTLYQGVREALQVAAGLPDPGVHQNAGIQANYIIPLLDIGAPPDRLDVVFKLHAQGAVVPGALQAAVDVA